MPGSTAGVRLGCGFEDAALGEVGVMDKTGAFFETWDSNGQNGCF